MIDAKRETLAEDLRSRCKDGYVRIYKSKEPETYDNLKSCHLRLWLIKSHNLVCTFKRGGLLVVWFYNPDDEIGE